MNMLLHNLKVALRNFLKYKVQTLVSILSLAIGMVTLSVAHSVLLKFQLPAICSEPYYDRAYTIMFDSIQKTPSQDSHALTGDIVRVMKANGGLRCIEQGPYAPNGLTGGWAEFTIGNNYRRKMQLDAIPIDCHYPNYAGVRSAITGKKIKVLKSNEAIISKSQARQIFGSINPVGAKLSLSQGNDNYQLTVVDVYQDLSNMERILDNNSLFFSPCALENMDFENFYYAVWLDVVLKEDATPNQLEAEANARLKPLGLKAKVESLDEKMSEDKSAVRIGVSITYLIGSLVLLTAIIGFLRMQTQLFWMRRREVSLRITNGATHWQLFSMFATEITFIIAMACAVAIAMDAWVYDFMITHLTDFMESIGDIDHFYLYTFCISIIVLVLCLVIIWMVLLRICRNGQGLEIGMRKSHNHWFRNVMLAVQIMISAFFLCTTFDFLKLSSELNDFNNIPQDESVYKKSLYLMTDQADDKLRLRDHLIKLPEVEKWIPYHRGFYRINELAENDKFCEMSWKNGDLSFTGKVTNYQTHFTSDTSWLDYFHVKVNWKPKANRTKCILVSDELYRRMHKFGIAPNGMLTIENEDALPIAGTYKAIPYQSEELNEKYSFIVIDPKERTESDAYILVPKTGEYNALKASVEKTIRQLEPAVVIQMAVNLRDNLAKAMLAVDLLQSVISVLACVSLVICLMSIFSTVMLDMRGRKKEVAIRKVNGALMRDIAKLLGKTYVMITGVGVVFAIVATLLFHVVVLENMGDVVDIPTPVLPIVLGVLLVFFFILAIIAWQVKSIMKVDPSEILAKE